jgi:hypothetical protein
MSERVPAKVFKCLAFNSFVRLSQKKHFIGFEILACGCGNITKGLICEDLSVNRTQSNSISSFRTYAGYSIGLKELLWEGEINVPTLTEKLLNCAYGDIKGPKQSC